MPGLGCTLHDLDKDDILITAFDNYGGLQGGFYRFLNKAVVRPGGLAILEAIVRDPERTAHARSLSLLQFIGAPIVDEALHSNAARSPSPAESTGSSGSSAASRKQTRHRVVAAMDYVADEPDAADSTRL